VGSRWTWRLLALPGVLWLAVFFLIAFYAVIAGRVREPEHALRGPSRSGTHSTGTSATLLDTLQNIWNGDQFPDRSSSRTFAFVAIALFLSLLIGYPVAYFAARHAGPLARALVLLLLILPFWINYLMRMLAWINLLSPDGLGNQVSSARLGSNDSSSPPTSSRRAGGWLEGQPFTVIMALTYGYLPFLILPLYAALDRIDQRQIEAARDLGASPAGAFRRGDAAALAAGDPRRARADRTADVRRLLHARPRLLVDEDDDDRETRSTSSRARASEKVVGASLTLILAVVLLGLMFYYLRATRSSEDRATG